MKKQDKTDFQNDIKNIIFVIKMKWYKVIIHKIKRHFQRLVINSRRNMLKDTYIQRSENENEIISICRDLIKNKNSELLLCPKTWERYVINEKLQMDIIINDRSIDIINHTYHYNEPICEKTHSIIMNIFDGHVEKRRQDLKKRIFSNVKHSLNTIYDKVKNDLTETNIK